MGVNLRIGVLAVQGAFVEHERRVAELGATPFEIRERSDLSVPLDGLILPGGESTVQGKLLHELGLFEPLYKKIDGGLPTFGTCAGLILLARQIENDSTVHFGLLDVMVARNAYGRQLGSFHAQAPFEDERDLPLTFIRAPKIVSLGDAVKPLVLLGNVPVAVQQGNLVAAAFHPELDEDTRLHARFLTICRTYRP